jgi:hypothetical protein
MASRTDAAHVRDLENPLSPLGDRRDGVHPVVHSRGADRCPCRMLDLDLAERSASTGGDAE